MLCKNFKYKQKKTWTSEWNKFIIRTAAVSSGWHKLQEAKKELPSSAWSFRWWWCRSLLLFAWLGVIFCCISKSSSWNKVWLFSFAICRFHNWTRALSNEMILAVFDPVVEIIIIDVKARKSKLKIKFKKLQFFVTLLPKLKRYIGEKGLHGPS